MKCPQCGKRRRKDAPCLYCRRLAQDLIQSLAQAINCHSAENGSNTPDFILAEFLADCLGAFDKASCAREKWYGKSLSNGGDKLFAHLYQENPQ